MGFLKDILIGGAAWKALKRSDRPGVCAPPGYTLLGMQHIGLGSQWKIIYCKNDVPNVKLHFTIGRNSSGMYTGADKWQIQWD